MKFEIVRCNMKVLDLFSGIGGFSLGLERAGMQTVAFCEIDKKARAVLKKHWPEVPIYDDVKTLTKEKLDANGIVPDIIVGGFPCQDISLAGFGSGLEGERSGLWWEFHRLIAEIQPQWVIIENVAALRTRGLDQVLRSLAEIGYDAEWHCIPASAVGAPHKRDRIWIVAYPNSDDRWDGRSTKSQERESWMEFGSGRQRQPESKPDEALADAEGQRVQGLWSGWEQEPYPYVQPPILMRPCQRPASANWETEPDVGRVVDGFPTRVDRIKQLGNSVVPQIPEIIGNAIMRVANV